MDNDGLFQACAAGHEKIVRQMIPYATDLNTQSATQNTAMIYASAAGHLDVRPFLFNFLLLFFVMLLFWVYILVAIVILVSWTGLCSF